VKRWFIGLAAVAIAIGGFTLAYRGPGRALVRGHLGDVAATMLVYALLGLLVRARPAVRAAATFAIALAIETGQLVWHARSTAGALTIGSTFDWWDVLAYAIGVAIAIACELCSAHATARPARADRL